MRRTHLSTIPRLDGALIALAIAGGAAAEGCVSSAALVPLVPHADGVAVVEKAGIVLSAEAKPGLLQVPPDVMPIRISIENKADNGIYVDLADIQLEGAANTFVLLAAEDIRPRRPVGLSMDPASPYASAQGAAALQYGLPGGTANFNVDPTLGYTSGDGWRSITSRELVMSAFEGGYIDVGESQRGLVFFKTTPDASGRLTLRVRVRAGSGSAPVETLEIPYTYSLEG